MDRAVFLPLCRQKDPGSVIGPHDVGNVFTIQTVVDLIRWMI